MSLLCRRPWRVVVVLLVLALVPSAPVRAQSVTPPSATVLLGGVEVRVPVGGRQVLTVRHTRGTHARLVLWERAGGRWRAVRRTSQGRTGYGGLVAPTRRHQGTGTTPLGTVRLIAAFGSHAPRADWHLPYRRVQKGDYWVEDNRSAYYNRYRNRSSGGFRWRLPVSDENGSERLADYPRQYEYAVVTDYNYHRRVRHRGAGIFLHVNGAGATAGCVSGPRWFVRAVLDSLDARLEPVMAVGR